MPNKSASEAEWRDAKRLCRLSAADLKMAKELGFAPRSLIKNIPTKAQPWKAPVSVWVRELYAKRQRRIENRRRRREHERASELDVVERSQARERRDGPERRTAEPAPGVDRDRT